MSKLESMLGGDFMAYFDRLAQQQWLTTVRDRRRYSGRPPWSFRAPGEAYDQSPILRMLKHKSSKETVKFAGKFIREFPNHYRP